MSKKINKKENIMSKKINKKENITSVKNMVIFFLVGVIIILGGVLVFSNIQNNPSSTTQDNAGPQPRILVSEEEWDFGKVTRGEKPTHVFIVKNGGAEDLIIDSLKESCACLEVSISTTLIQPGESAELKVSYDTTDYAGKDEKHIHIYSNDPQEADKRIDLYVEIEVLQIPNIIPNLQD